MAQTGHTMVLLLLGNTHNFCVNLVPVDIAAWEERICQAKWVLLQCSRSFHIGGI